MVRLTVGDGSEGTFEELPAMRGVELFLESADFQPAEGNYKDRIKFVYEITGGNAEAEHVGKKHFVWANTPGGKSGKLSPNSNLYELLEGMSGGEFNPDDEVDTDDYVGRKFLGDFKREPKKKNAGTPQAPQFVADIDPDTGKPRKKTVLRNLQPLQPRRRPAAAPAQEEMDWDEDDDE